VEVEPLVAEKVRVLTHEDGVDQPSGDSLERDPLLDAIFSAVPHERGLLGVLALEEVHFRKSVPEPRGISQNGHDEGDEGQSRELLLAHEPTVW